MIRKGGKHKLQGTREPQCAYIPSLELRGFAGSCQSCLTSSLPRQLNQGSRHRGALGLGFGVPLPRVDCPFDDVLFCDVVFVFLGRV